MELLFVVDRLMWPPRRDGIAVRYYPILKLLAETHSLNLLLIADNPDPTELQEMGKLCKITVIEGKTKYRWVQRLKVGLCYLLPWSRPMELYRYDDNVKIRQIRKAIKGRGYDAAIIVWSMLSRFLPAIKKTGCAKKYIVDMIDSPSLIRSRRQKGLLARIDGVKWRHWERNLSAHLIYISQVDASYVRSGAVIPNGLFDDCADEQRGKRWDVAFLGNMSYSPNVNAAKWLYEHVSRPLGLSTVIIGRDPSPEVKALDAEITGTVDSIWPYLQESKVAVFPMFTGGGLQNKVLEAMRAGIPVVTTPICAASIGSKDILVCETPEEFQKTVKQLLDSPEIRERIGEAGKNFVLRTFDWNAIIQEYEAVLQL